MARNAENTVETTPVTYLQFISQDEKSVKVEALKLTAQEAALNLNKDLFDLTSSLSKARASLYKAQRAIPYSVQVEYKITKEISELETRIAFVNEIKAERFSDASI